jgi:hypothetical protein
VKKNEVDLIESNYHIFKEEKKRIVQDAIYYHQKRIRELYREVIVSLYSITVLNMHKNERIDNLIFKGNRNKI